MAFVASSESKNTRFCRRTVKIPREKILSNLAKYGNTSAATIPLVMDEAIRNQSIKQNDIIATSGFGAGLSWGAALIKWG